MEEITISELEPININLGGDDSKSTNFGSGIELLMNDKNKSSSQTTNIDIGDLDKLEDELNDAANINLNKSNFEPQSTPLPFDTGIKIKFEETDSNLGKETVESIGKSSTWDGFVKMNEIPEEKPIPTNLSERDKKRKKRQMIKSLNEWSEKGYIKDPTRFDMNSTYEEVEDEYEGAVEDKRKRDSVKIQQNWLITFINTIEYGNSMFDPFGVNLDGWGEQIGEDIDSYDEIFEELYEKYKGGKMSPELSLLLRLGFSASVVHFSNRALSSATPGFNDVIKQSPELMRMFTNATVDAMKNTSPGMAFAEELLNTKPNPSAGPPPAPVETRSQQPPTRPGQMQFTQSPGNRPDLNVGRGMFKEQGVELNSASNVNEPPKPKRPEMSGPKNADIDNILSGLKTKPSVPTDNNIVVNIHEKNDEDSVLSVTSLSNLEENGLPKKSKRRNRSDKKVVSLDL